MKKTVMLVLLDRRTREAVEVQKVLTEWGCIIKTRIGLHEGTGGECTDYGLIILELTGDAAQYEKFEKKLRDVPGVTTKLVVMEPPVQG
jgi:ribose 5-phosphate isomerase